VLSFCTQVKPVRATVCTGTGDSEDKRVCCWLNRDDDDVERYDRERKRERERLGWVSCVLTYIELYTDDR